MPKPRLGYKKGAEERNLCFTRTTQVELNTDSLFIFGQYGGIQPGVSHLEGQSSTTEEGNRKDEGHSDWEAGGDQCKRGRMERQIKSRLFEKDSGIIFHIYLKVYTTYLSMHMCLHIHTCLHICVKRCSPQEPWDNEKSSVKHEDTPFESPFRVGQVNVG